MPAATMPRRRTVAPRRRSAAPPTTPQEWAALASLHYVSDTGAGITRTRRGEGFTYRTPDGAAIRDKDRLTRIASLAIPPAWTRVWISPLPGGHMQATGRDVKGRKQYRYHPQWHAVRDENKYDRMLQFGAALPALRHRVMQDLAGAPQSRERVLAIVVRLLETTYIRVGNEEYARTNGSFGLTTLRNKHVRVTGDTLRFEFVGKSGKAHSICLTDRRLSRLVRSCRDLPGQLLFQFRHEDGTLRPVSSTDVNAYLREITSAEFTAKDFRTWAGSLLAACYLDASGAAELPEALPDGRTGLPAVLAVVSRQLGNTPAVCRRGYIHPMILNAHIDPAEVERWVRCRARARERNGLTREESALLTFLESR